MRRFFLLLGLFAGLLLVAACGDDSSGGSVSVSDDLVAVVGDREITVAQLDRQIELRQKAAEVAKEELPKAGSEEYRTQVVRPLVDQLVTAAQVENIAKELGVTVSDEDVQKALDDAIQQQYGGDAAQFEKDAQKFGFEDGEVEEFLIRPSLLQQKVQEKLTEQNEITDEDMQKYYDEHKADYQTQESREVEFMLVGSREDAIAARLAVAQGDSWKSVAKKYAIPPGPPSTGGTFTATNQQGAIEENFRQAVFSGMATGELSALVPVSKEYEQSNLQGKCKPDCFFLVRPLEDAKEGSQQTFDEVKAQIRATLQSTVQQPAIQKRIQSLLDQQKDETSYNQAYAPPKDTSSGSTGGATSP